MPVFDQLTPLVVLAQAENAPGNWLSLLMPFLMIMVLFYLLMVVPDKRKRAELGRMQEALKKNDRVVTFGGILGVVVNTHSGSDRVTLRIDESNNTRIEVLRSSIAQVLSEDKADSAKSEG